MKNTALPVKAAEEVLDSLGNYALPIDIESLITSRNISVTYEIFPEDLSGVLVKSSKGGVQIGVNARHSETRQRFTLAHELAHYLLKHQGDLFVDHSVFRRDNRSSLAIDQYEIDANQFAAEILMPRDRVRTEFRKIYSTENIDIERTIKKLAKLFFVSPKAMEYRLVNLNLIEPA